MQFSSKEKCMYWLGLIKIMQLILYFWSHKIKETIEDFRNFQTSKK